MHVMLDLETLGTRPNAAIVQIGAVLFEPVSGGKVLNDKGFNRHVLVQDGAGTVDHGTIAWWLQQRGAAGLGKGMESAIPLGQALAELVQWPTEAKQLPWEAIGAVWAKPASFDLPIMASAYALFGGSTPWAHNRTRCAKTVLEMAGNPEIDWTGLTHHDAFDDAVGQAMQLQKAFQVLDGKAWGVKP